MCTDLEPFTCQVKLQRDLKELRELLIAETEGTSLP